MPLSGIVAGIYKCAAISGPLVGELITLVLVAYIGLNRDKFLRINLTPIHNNRMDNRRVLQYPRWLAAVDEA